MKTNKIVFLLLPLFVLVSPLLASAAFTLVCPAGSTNCNSIQYFCGGKSYTDKSEYEICLEKSKEEQEQLEKDRLKLEEEKKEQVEDELNQKIQKMVEVELEKEREKIRTVELEKVKLIQESTEIKAPVMIPQKIEAPIIEKREVINTQLKGDIKEEKIENQENPNIETKTLDVGSEIKEKQSFTVRVFVGFKNFFSKIFGF